LTTAAGTCRRSKGGAKKTVGRVTGNPRVQAEGRCAQAATLNRPGAKIKDAFKR
jgi:uncharacterized protein YjbJ (UPF0337 family)